MIQTADESIWQVKAAEGPSLCIIGGMHGNERTGIEVVEQLVQEFVAGNVQLIKGTLTIILGNPIAIAQGVRYFEGRDLNRYFTHAQLDGAGDGSLEQARAQVLAQYISRADITLDLHATNKPAEPFISSRADSEHERVYRWFSARKVLVDPDYILAGEPATTDEYADRVGKCGVCVETGYAGDTSRVDEVFDSVINLMRDLGMVLSGSPACTSVEREVYVLKKAIILDGSGFQFAEGKGLKSFELVQEGDVIGFRGADAVVVERGGVIVFPKLPEHQVPGRPVCYLAELL